MTEEWSKQGPQDQEATAAESPTPGEPQPPQPAGEPEPQEPQPEPSVQADEGPPPPPLPEGVSPLDLLEALIFSSTEALSTERLAKATGLTPVQVKENLSALATRLEESGRPYVLQALGRGWRLLTRPVFHPFIARLRGIKKQEGLSRAALETLAVVAYRQPIIRAEIEDIRGVQCGPMLRALLERKLIRVAGRAQVPGRPLLYATTPTFLDRFGLKDLKDLPSLREFKEGGGSA